MAFESYLPVILAIILGTLGAIVYSLRILVLLERRVARMDHHIELMTMSVLKGEQKIMAEEQKIERMLSGRKASPKKASKKKAKKKKR